MSVVLIENAPDTDSLRAQFAKVLNYLIEVSGTEYLAILVKSPWFAKTSICDQCEDLVVFYEFTRVGLADLPLALVIGTHAFLSWL